MRRHERGWPAFEIVFLWCQSLWRIQLDSKTLAKGLKNQFQRSIPLLPVFRWLQDEARHRDDKQEGLRTIQIHAACIQLRWQVFHESFWPSVGSAKRFFLKPPNSHSRQHYGSRQMTWPGFRFPKVWIRTQSVLAKMGCSKSAWIDFPRSWILWARATSFCLPMWRYSFPETCLIKRLTDFLRQLLLQSL